MGVVCGLYRMNKATIEQLKNHPEQAQAYIDENYARVSGQFHIDDELTFEMDKAWDIARFLLQKCDPTNDKKLKLIDGSSFIPADGWDAPRYIDPEKVPAVHDTLQMITLQQMVDANDQEEMIQKNVYAAEWWDEPDWDYFQSHIETIKKAFAKAAENRDGLILNFH